MMDNKEFAELLIKLEKIGLNDGDIGYSYWYHVQKDLKQMWEIYNKYHENAHKSV